MNEIAEIFATGIVLGLSAGLSPGPLMTLVVAESLKGGASAGIRMALAPLVTDAPIIILSLLLLSTVAQAIPFLGLLTLLGGLFMAWMGVANITFTGAGMSSGPSNQTASLRTGIIANLLNPNPYLFWLTVGGPIILSAGRRSTASAGLFLFCFYGCLVGSKIVLAAVVGHTRRFLKSRAYVWIIRSLGILLVVFAGLFFLEGLKYLGWL